MVVTAMNFASDQRARLKGPKATILLPIILTLYAEITVTPKVEAYPEYQQFIEQHSHKTVNCAMCHVNDNGPVGNEHGQIGALDKDQLVRLNKARAALLPGQVVDSPILNQFGNEIIKALGKKEFLACKTDPSKLAQLLGDTSDLDEDGIPDSKEYLDGTDPLNKFHGDPVKLFMINLNRNKIHVILAIVAVLSINFGLIHLIKAIMLTQASSRKGH
jgi:hypothetical protein